MFKQEKKKRNKKEGGKRYIETFFLEERPARRDLLRGDDRPGRQRVGRGFSKLRKGLGMRRAPGKRLADQNERKET